MFPVTGGHLPCRGSFFCAYILVVMRRQYIMFKDRKRQELLRDFLDAACGSMSDEALVELRDALKQFDGQSSGEVPTLVQHVHREVSVIATVTIQVEIAKTIPQDVWDSKRFDAEAPSEVAKYVVENAGLDAVAEAWHLREKVFDEAEVKIGEGGTTWRVVD